MKVKRIFAGVLLSFISLFFALVVTEFALRRIPITYKADCNSSWWYRAKWYNSHRYGVTNLAYSIDEYHSIYGWTLKPNLNNYHVNENSSYTLNSNKAGLRGQTDYDVSDSKIRILTMGDSFTFGECVNDSDTYPARLQSMIVGSEVINAAVHGWGNDQMLLRLQQDGKTYRPSIILLGCFNDDLLRNHLWFRDYAKPHFELEADSLILKGVPVGSPQELLLGFHLYTFDFFTSKMALLFGGTDVSDSDELSEKILIQLVNECRKLNAVPVFVYNPWKGECISGRSEPSAVFQRVCKNENVLWIDPVDSIYKSIRSLPNPEKEFACHYSPFVNGIIAAKIKEQLSAANILAEPVN